MKKPPTISTGDQIDLNPLLNKTIAVRVSHRRVVETRYGDRSMVDAKIYVLGQKDPLEGVLFATYFTKYLDLDTWYCGVLSKDDKRWMLTPAPAKSEAALAKMIETDEDVPF